MVAERTLNDLAREPLVTLARMGERYGRPYALAVGADLLEDMKDHRDIRQLAGDATTVSAAAIEIGRYLCADVFVGPKGSGVRFMPPAYRAVDTARGRLRAPTLDHPRVAAFVAGLPRRGRVRVTTDVAGAAADGLVVEINGADIVDGWPRFEVIDVQRFRTLHFAEMPCAAPRFEPEYAGQLVERLMSIGLAARVDGETVIVEGLTIEGVVARMLFEPNAGGLTLTDALAALGYSHEADRDGRRHIYRGASRLTSKAALPAWDWLRAQAIARGLVPARLREGE